MILLGVLALAGVAVFASLGVWQVERLFWKLDLIQRVEERAQAAPVPAPGPEDWPAVTAASQEYRRVSVTGRFLNDKETLVQAVTERGGGFWVLTPLRTDRGFTVLVNRGFVPPERRSTDSRPDGLIGTDTTVTGLLRVTEPGGGFLRSNDPAQDRWYSRDVAAIAAARGLTEAAPYFIDAEASPPGGSPIGGLTVLKFRNNHLVYALTWFALAFMLIAASLYVARSERRRRG
ncbi:SURF1 family protein [Azospirillum sp. Vi22]|nr:SURF1 family protein [Azospirillum baldaniorum]NUB07178.1 SURF1 family protein [Azospirillum baldaniorum]